MRLLTQDLMQAVGAGFALVTVLVLDLLATD
jgi:hypothetical protein